MKRTDLSPASLVAFLLWLALSPTFRTLIPGGMRSAGSSTVFSSSNSRIIAVFEYARGYKQRPAREEEWVWLLHLTKGRFQIPAPSIPVFILIWSFSEKMPSLTHLQLPT